MHFDWMLPKPWTVITISAQNVSSIWTKRENEFEVQLGYTPTCTHTHTYTISHTHTQKERGRKCIFTSHYSPGLGLESESGNLLLTPHLPHPTGPHCHFLLSLQIYNSVGVFESGFFEQTQLKGKRNSDCMRDTNDRKKKKKKASKRAMTCQRACHYGDEVKTIAYCSTVNKYADLTMTMWKTCNVPLS